MDVASSNQTTTVYVWGITHDNACPYNVLLYAAYYMRWARARWTICLNGSTVSSCYAGW